MNFIKYDSAPHALGIFDGTKLLGVYPIAGIAPSMQTWRGLIAENHPDFIGREGNLTALTVPADPLAIVEIMADELMYSEKDGLSDRLQARQTRLAELAKFLSATQIQ